MDLPASDARAIFSALGDIEEDRHGPADLYYKVERSNGSIVAGILAAARNDDGLILKILGDESFPSETIPWTDISRITIEMVTDY